MLGPQNGSQIHDNWVYNQHTASSGALYPDEGSAYSTWKHNVVTDIGNSEWLHLWTGASVQPWISRHGIRWHRHLNSSLRRSIGSIHNVTVQENYADTKVFVNRGTNCPMVDNTIFTPGHPPAAAIKIMNASGVNSTNPFLPRL